MEVDIDQRVEFVKNDIDVIGSYACAQSRDGQATIESRMRHEFTIFDFMLNMIKQRRNERYPARVTDQQDHACQLFRSYP
jgi:hypothetical protein